MTNYFVPSICTFKIFMYSDWSTLPVGHIRDFLLLCYCDFKIRENLLDGDFRNLHRNTLIQKGINEVTWWTHISKMENTSCIWNPFPPVPPRLLDCTSPHTSRTKLNVVHLFINWTYFSSLKPLPKLNKRNFYITGKVSVDYEVNFFSVFKLVTDFY